MEYSMEAQSKLVPEMMEVMQERYRMLKYVKVAGPIGRRLLGEMSGLSERETRTMMDFLREQHLISVAKNGTTITAEGNNVLEALELPMEKWSGRVALATRLTNLLGVRSVKVVAGNSDADGGTKNLLGMAAAKVFVSELGDGVTIAVTGGSTVASIPNYINKMNHARELLFVAARGGVGEDIGLQANVIAASFAEACGGTYNTFHYPESLSEEAHEAFRKEPSVLKMIQLYEKVDCVLHGIGDAQTMANLRGSDAEERHMLKEEGAKGEAFGYYFDRTGKVVHRLRTVGIRPEQLKRVPLPIAIAGGRSKAEAILSYMASAPKQTVLVTDEGAANEMVNLLTQ
ncbi:sugar-binding transcriptional regulator [Sporosarcina sp. 6E9]|uniref:sugar-binding transcriptional regulator n=1 Tax=Sporosarcina sp. 6E9 TaxID=2819235 RepID=UPI001B31780C|nr:sugar-binding domain-containing protein [Sporosarcina sp. 6E9]